jgi:hypothetical protein
MRNEKPLLVGEATREEKPAALRASGSPLLRAASPPWADSISSLAGRGNNAKVNTAGLTLTKPLTFIKLMVLWG